MKARLGGGGARAAGAAVGPHHTQKHALAQPPVGDGQRRQRPDMADGGIDGAARQHEIDPFRADAGMRGQPGPAEREEVAERLVGGFHGERPAIHQRPAVARQGQRHAGERRDGAAGADEADAAGADLLADAMHPVEGEQMGRHLLHHRVEAFLGEAGGTGALRQGDDAERQGDIADQLRHGGAGRAAAAGRDADPGDLGAAAADVEEQGAAVRLLQQRGAGFHRQLGFLARRDGAGAEAGLGLDPGEEGGAVGGAAAGFGGDGLELADGGALPHPRRFRRPMGDRRRRRGEILDPHGFQRRMAAVLVAHEQHGGGDPACAKEGRHGRRRSASAGRAYPPPRPPAPRPGGVHRGGVGALGAGVKRRRGGLDLRYQPVQRGEQKVQRDLVPAGPA